VNEELRYGEYRLENVYGDISPAVRDEIVAFWLAQRALLDEREARRRVAEVAFLVRNPGGEIVGLNTVYKGAIRSVPVYFYRSFVRAGDRDPGLSRSLLRSATRYFATRGDARGIAFVAENPKLTRRGAVASVQRLGFRLLGTDPAGRQVFVQEFPLPNAPA
jgi:hypothetical protein